MVLMGGKSGRGGGEKGIFDSEDFPNLAGGVGRFLGTSRLGAELGSLFVADLDFVSLPCGKGRRPRCGGFFGRGCVDNLAGGFGAPAAANGLDLGIPVGEENGFGLVPPLLRSGTWFAPFSVDA